MNFSLRIARRYLFSRKSHNVVNLISAVTAAGVMLSTVALVCVLSVYNGFEDLLERLCSAFDPEIKITAVHGKTFERNAPDIVQALTTEGIGAVSYVLEENALLRNAEKQLPVRVKGVDGQYMGVTGVSGLVVAGAPTLSVGGEATALVGVGVASLADIGVGYVKPFTLYAPRRTKAINLANPGSSFNTESLMVSGVFAVKQAQYDERIVVVPIEVGRRLFEYDSLAVSAIEIACRPSKTEAVKRELRKTLDPTRYVVADRREQQGDYFRISRMEKWISYLLLSFILLIAVFNIIGSLTMLIVDKRKDIRLFGALGATRGQIGAVFRYEGWLIALMGCAVGIIIGVGLCLVQQTWGLIRLAPVGSDPSDFIIAAYPVVVKVWDLVVIFATVSVVSFVAVSVPIRSVGKGIF